MKKILALALAVMLMASLATSAFADEPATQPPKDIDVKGEYVDNSTTPDKISVDITWGAMTFTYTVSGENKWNEAEHRYDDKTTAKWTVADSENAGKITVTNHSNVDVTVDFAFQAGKDYDGLSGSFTNASIQLPSAVGKEKNDASLVGTTDLELSGALSSSTVSGSTIGSIIVTFKKSN